MNSANAPRVPWQTSPATKTPKSALLNVHELERFGDLLVFAQATVEGSYVGKHKSPYRGSAAEFADYKEYVPGDELAHLDWRVYGRTRRLYSRQYEEETDMTVYLLVDHSASMKYAGGKREPKSVLAAKTAAALAYLMLAQGDKAALATFTDKVTAHVPAGGTKRHLHRILTTLENALPSDTTGLAQALHDSVAIFKRRGRLVIISDFLDDHAQLFDALAHFVHRKFEILLLHVVDPDELNLPVAAVARFVDLETGEGVQVDPEEVRTQYRETMQNFLSKLEAEADALQIQHRLVSTERPYLDAIEAYLGFRGKNTLGR
jgi:uncharacterized protein (DUF58 family)